MRIAAIIPTRNRPERLNATLDALGRMEAPPLDEVIVIDNASDSRRNARPASRLANGAHVRWVQLDRNAGAAARNVGAEMTSAEWLLMLDDDSHPTPARGRGSDVIASGIQCEARDDEDVFAIGGRIRLSGGGHEAGGLPEVFIGCGALVRREAFLALGGYDESFEYYAEEYDLCARAIAAGWRIRHDDRLEVLHHKVSAGRDMDHILRLLVRNNGWVIQRYAPDDQRQTGIESMIDRYRAIAVKERAVEGFERGCAELHATLEWQPRRALSNEQYGRFIGRAAVERWLPQRLHESCSRTVTLHQSGKGIDIIRDVIRDAGIEVIDEVSSSGEVEHGRAAARAHSRSGIDDAGAAARAIVIGSLAPGAIADGVLDARRKFAGGTILPPWPCSFAVSHRA